MRKCLFVLFLICGVEASEALPNGSSLEELVSEVLHENPELRFYETEIKATRGERRAVGTLQNPELSSTVGQKRVDGLSSEGVAWSVSVQQPFEWPGRIALRKAIANQDIKLAALGLERFRGSLAARARTLGYKLYSAQRRAEAASEVAKRFQALQEVVLQRDPAGVTPLLEQRILEANTITFQRRASEAAISARDALLELNQLRGKPLLTKISLKPPTLSFSPPQSMEALLDGARANNFELRQRITELEQQGFRVELAKNERYPAFSVGPFYSEEKGGETERTVGVGISVPLPLWNRNRGNIEAASARKTQAETSLLVAQRQIEREVTEAILLYETKLQEIQKWHPEVLERLKEASELGDRHYRLGAVPIATYVELQREYLEAIEAILETNREALEAGQTLELLTGVNLRDAPKKGNQ